MTVIRLLCVLAFGVGAGLAFKPLFFSIFGVATRGFSRWRLPRFMSSLGASMAGMLAVSALLIVLAKLLVLIFGPMPEGAPFFGGALLCGAVIQELMEERSRRRRSRDDLRP